MRVFWGAMALALVCAKAAVAADTEWPFDEGDAQGRYYAPLDSEDIFVEQCSRCHVFGPNITPDLSKLTPALHAMFNDIVLHDAFAPMGMANFSDVLTETDTDAIHAYLIDQARQGYAKQGRGGDPD